MHPALSNDYAIRIGHYNDDQPPTAFNYIFSCKDAWVGLLEKDTAHRQGCQKASSALLRGALERLFLLHFAQIKT
jgi:hypothetical protein